VRGRRGAGRARRRVGLVLLGLVVAAGLLVGLVRPARIVLPPRLLGLTCAGAVCTDRAGRLPEAQALYAAAVAANTRDLGPVVPIRRVVLCTTDTCFHTFSGGRATATTIADLGIVVSPSGWQDHYLRHELVHHWQARELGLVARYRDPRWLIEGMAYALSDDPRPTLVEPNQTYRTRFVRWYASVGPANLWPAARSVRPGDG
jgi:hypothetical protein